MRTKQFFSYITAGKMTRFDKLKKRHKREN